MSSNPRFRLRPHLSTKNACRRRTALSLVALESRVTPVRKIGSLTHVTDMAGAATAPAVTGPMWTELSPRFPRRGRETELSQSHGILAVLAQYVGWIQFSAMRPRNNRLPLRIARPSSRMPKPDGTTAHFRIDSVQMLDTELSAQFPLIHTYRGQGIEDRTATLDMDVTYQGFHAQVLSPNGEWFIDPYFHLDTSVYASYFGHDLLPRPDMPPLDDDLEAPPQLPSGSTSDAQGGIVANRANGSTLRTFRAAVAATGEYTAFQGGTVALGLSAIVTAMNRVSGVYETELAIRLTLIANENLIIYTNAATDPYTNNNPSIAADTESTNFDSVIGNLNYDIGHVFSTGGGGLAQLNCVGSTGNKAKGETGTSTPIGDGFDIDYVAHEMGHQFGGNHTFNTANDTGNRNASTAYEPGSGSTIMAYAGIEGSEDLQPHSDPYFHSVSYNEILAYVATIPSVGTSCFDGQQYSDSNGRDRGTVHNSDRHAVLSDRNWDGRERRRAYV